MAKRNLPEIRVRKVRQPRVEMPSPEKPNFHGEEGEVLAGTVNGMKASAPEERLFRALKKNPKVQGMEFRYTIGAPRGLPGWKEVDYLVASLGLVYAIEVDTAFTHRGKKESDRLHDAIVLNALRQQGLNVYPSVIHLDGESELVDQKNADTTVRRMFG